MEKRKKTRLIIACSVIALVVLTVGVTFALFTYVRSGTTENTISSGTITFIYDEVDQQGNGIGITDALPMSDTDGKAQSIADSFDFRIVSNTKTNVAIPYEITVRKSATSDDIGNIVKLYLAKTTDSTTPVGSEQQVALSTYNSLPDVTKNGHTEKLIYDEIVPASNDPYNQGYRLKMWINSGTEFNTVTKYYCGTTEITAEQFANTEYTCANNEEKSTQEVYPYNDKTFSVTVNVYAEGRLLTNGALYASSEVSYQAPSGANSTCTGQNATVECALNELSQRIR